MQENITQKNNTITIENKKANYFYYSIASKFSVMKKNEYNMLQIHL